MLFLNGFARRPAGALSVLCFLFSGGGHRPPPLCYNDGMRSGQTMVEYILVLVALLGAALAAGFLVKAVNAQEARTETLLGSGYP